MKKNNYLKLIIIFMILVIISSLSLTAKATSVVNDEQILLGGTSADQIHFIKEKVGSSSSRNGDSDAILIETNGHFGLVDAGWGADENVEHLRSYLASVLGDAKLDFVIATHYHYDHVGGMGAVKDFVDEKTVLFYKNLALETNRSNYNKVMNNMPNSAKCEVSKKDFSMITNSYIKSITFKEGNVSTTNVDDYVYFKFGDFEIQMYNLHNIIDDPFDSLEENSNSIVTLVKKGTQKVALMGDIEAKLQPKTGNSTQGVENQLADIIGAVTILKTGHHGNTSSNSLYLLQKMKPKYTIQTAGWKTGKLKDSFRYAGSILKKNGGVLYVTGNSLGGIIARLKDDNTVTMYDYNPALSYTDNFKDGGTRPTKIDLSNIDNRKGWNQIAKEIYDPEVPYKYRMWKYVKSDGTFAKGWLQIGGRWYYFAQSDTEFSGFEAGQMVTGWKKLEWNGEKYWFYFVQNNSKYSGTKEGEMLTGRHQVIYNGTSSYYYFCETAGTPAGYVKGAMVANATVGSYHYDDKGAYVDKVAPGYKVTYSSTEPTNGDVKVTIQANEEIKVVSGSGWKRSTNQTYLTKVFTANTTETITISDLAETPNKVSITIKVNVIDKDAPELTVTQTPTSPTNGDVVVKVVANEPIQYTTNMQESGWIQVNSKTIKKTMTSNVTASRKIYDLAGNAATLKVTINNIDRTAPTFNISYSKTEPTNQDVVATVVASEPIQYTENMQESGWTQVNDKTYKKTYSNNTNASRTVKDLAGNSGTFTVTINNIDKTEPEVTVTQTPTAPTNEYVTVTVKANEDIQFTTDMESKGWVKVNNKTVQKIFDSNTNGDVSRNILDLAGNAKKITVNISNIDKEAPKLTVTKNPETPTNGKVVVTVKANEDIKLTTDMQNKGWTKVNEKTVQKEYTSNTSASRNIYDLAGNGTPLTVTIDNIDTTAPELTVTKTPETPTNKNVTVTVKANEDIQFTTDMENKGWTKVDNKTVKKVFESNTDGEVSRDIYDIAGNSRKITVNIDNIDKTAPILQDPVYSPNTLTKEDVTVTITANEEIKANGWTRSSDGKTITKKYSQNTSETVKVQDLAGNIIDVPISIDWIDSTAFKVQDPVYSKEDLTNEDVTVTITANKEINNVSGWTLSSDKKSISKKYSVNATETVTIESLTHETQEKTVSIDWIDKTVPDMISTEYTPKELTKGDVVVTITFNEEIKEIEGWTRSEDGKSITKTYEENTTETVRAEDLAGNSKDVPISIDWIDKTTLSVISKEYSPDKTTNGEVTVTIIVNKKIKDIEGWTRTSNLFADTISKTYSDNTNEIVVIEDLVGNIIQENVNITWIDKVKPEVTSIAYSPDSPTKENVTVTIIANEEIKDVDGWTKSSNGRVLTKTYSDNTNETITIEDIAGNTKEQNIEINWIDRTEPDINVQYSPDSPTIDDVAVTIVANEELKEKDGWTRSEDGKSITKYYGENTTETVRVEDLAGNTKDVPISINWIDASVFKVVSREYSPNKPTNGNVTATIRTSKEINEVEGWTLSTDKKSLSKVFEDNGSETIMIEATTGENITETVDINWIDRIEPDANAQYSPDSPTRDDVAVTIVANEELKEKEGWTISDDGKSITKYYEENTTETVRVEDLAGNIREVPVSIDWIDRDAPEVESKVYSPDKLTSGNVTVRITTNEEIQEVPGWTRSSNGRMITKIFTDNADETITIKDLAGNTREESIHIDWIDSTDLRVVSKTYSPNSLTKENVVVKITTNKELNEVNGWTLSSDRKTITKSYSKNTDETIILEDTSGNSREEQISIDWIDKTAPKLVKEYTPNTKTNEDVRVMITADEPIKELEGWDRSTDGKTLIKSYSENTNETITIEDLAGNTNKVDINIDWIDKISPELISRIYSPDSLTNDNVTATITVNEEIKEIQGWTLSSDRKTITKTYTENTSETIFLEDVVGNITEEEIIIDWIDKTAPTVTVIYENDEKFVVAKITADEEISPVNGWTLSKNKKELTKIFTENTDSETEVYVTDLVGNSTKVTIRKITEIEQNDEPFVTSEVYKVEDDTISRVSPNTSKEDFINNLIIENTDNVKVYNSNNEELSEQEIVTTDSILVIDDSIVYTLCVKGDLSGDGKVTVRDLALEQRKLLHPEFELTDTQYKAGDTDDNTKLTVRDLATIQRFILKGEGL